MSKAGINSNIGDEYQVYVATYWAMKMLADNSIEKLECEALFDGKGMPIQVDDVVVRYENGNALFCQCKVNSPTHKDWTVSALKNDLKKAWEQFSCSHQGASFIFYSSTSFGSLSKLADTAQQTEDVNTFIHKLSQNTKKELLKFQQTIQGSTDILCWKFFKKLSFRAKSLKELQSDINDYLEMQVTQKETALALIKEEIRRISSRQPQGEKKSACARQSSLSRKRLVEILEQAGCRVTRLLSEIDLMSYFQKISCRGRSWERDIEGLHFPRVQLKELKTLVDMKQDVLLYGEPGVGKTCILMDLLEELEKQYGYYPVFLQLREFDENDRKTLEQEFADHVARMAEFHRVVLLIDSLDVLSMTNESLFFVVQGMLEQLLNVKNVSVVAACRRFDLVYSSHFARLRQLNTVKAGDLDFEKEAAPCLKSNGIDIESLSEKQRRLVCNPRMLRMFLAVCKRCGFSQASTPYELAEEFLNRRGAQIWNEWTEIRGNLEDAALRMLAENRLSLHRSEIVMDEKAFCICVSEGFLLEEKRQRYTFTHQSLMDWLAVSRMRRERNTLCDFILSMPARPSIRSAVRTFLFSLRDDNTSMFRKQFRQVLQSEGVMFNIKWLLAKSLAEVEPEEEDGFLLYDLERDAALFFAYWEAASPEHWFSFFHRHFLPRWKQEKNWGKMIRLGVWSRNHESVPASELIELWIYLTKSYEKELPKIVPAITFCLRDFSAWQDPGLRELFTLLLKHVSFIQPVTLGKPLSKWVESSNDGDDLLWQFITLRVAPKHLDTSLTLLCAEHLFYKKGFLTRRLSQSENLLSEAIDTMEKWSATFGKPLIDGETRCFFSERTWDSCVRPKERLVSVMETLFSAVAYACDSHAEANSPWWQKHSSLLWASNELGMRYLCLYGLIKNPQSNIDLVKDIIENLHNVINGVFFKSSLSRLLNATSSYLDTEFLADVQRRLLKLEGEYFSAYPNEAGRLQHLYLSAIPAHLRLSETGELLNESGSTWSPSLTESETMLVGFVSSPCDSDTLLRLSEEERLRLLQYFSSPESDSEMREFYEGQFIGGPDELALALCDASRRSPMQFWPWIENHRKEISSSFIVTIIDGVARHAWSRFGNLHITGAKPPVAFPKKDWLLNALLDMWELEEAHNLHDHTSTTLLTACTSLATSPDEISKLRPLLLWEGWLSRSDEDTSVPLRDFLDSVQGEWISALFHAAQCWLEISKSLPDWLEEQLVALAQRSEAGGRAALLNALPSLKAYPELGWSLFDIAVLLGPDEIWDFAVEWLYVRLEFEYEKVMNYVEKIPYVSSMDAVETLGVILMSAFFSEKITAQEFIDKLVGYHIEEAWTEVVRMLVVHIHDGEQKEKAIEAMLAILEKASEKHSVVLEAARIFHRQEGAFPEIPYVIVERLLSAMKNFPDIMHSSYQLAEWCLFYSKHHSSETLSAMNIIWSCPNFFWGRERKEIVYELLKRFFGEAEELLDVDNGKMFGDVNSLLNLMIIKDDAVCEAWFGNLGY